MITQHEVIKNKSEWIRSIQPGEIKTGFFSLPTELDSISTLVSRFNNSLGREKGIRLTGRRNWVERSFTIECYKI